MEIFIVFLIIAIAIIGIKTNKQITKNYVKKEYAYVKKECIMTAFELKFYQILQECISGCVIIPQAHFSMFLEHRIKGQNWKAAFSRINGKSVDFLICNNEMKPLFAVELDDSTHNRLERQKRDIFVNSIMNNANIPLLRFKAGEWNNETIKQKVSQVFQTHASVDTDFQKSTTLNQD